MRPVRLAAIIFALLPALAAAGVIDTLWTRLYDGPNSNQLNMAADMFVDTAHGRIYVCGSGEAPLVPSVTNMLTACYRLDGTLLWANEYGGNTYSQYDMAHALAVDAGGNVYVAGVTGNAAPRGDDISWVKYDTSGNLVWAKKSLWPGDDAAFDIALGPDGSVYICGSGNDEARALTTFTLLKASAATGDTVWTRSYVLDTLAFKKKSSGRDVHPSFFDDFTTYDNCATALAIAADSGIVVTGFGLHLAYEKEWWTMKLRPNGDVVWSRSYHNPTTIYTDDDDAAFDVAIAASGDIYVCGFDFYDDGASSQGYNYAVGHFNSAGVRQNWRSLNAGAVDGDEYATSLCLDNASPQNVYVTGMLSLDQGDVTCTNRFSSTLTPRWGTAGAIYGAEESYGYRVAYRDGRAYVTGYADGDLAAICYSETDPLPGNPKDSLWSLRYRTPGGYDALGAAITALDSNRIWVAGQCERPGLTSLVLARLGHVARDAAVDTVYAPRGTFNIGDTATPRARVSNAGTDSAFVRVWFSIGAAYRDSSTTFKLRAGEMVTINFRLWTATVPGNFAAVCSIATSGDPNPANNTKSAMVTVNDIDVGCYRIVAPPDTVPLNTSIRPEARVRNYGSTGQLFNVRFAISDGFADTVRNVSVPAGDSLLVTAVRSWTATQPGNWVVSCSTMLAGDLNRANDRATKTVTVTGHDIAVTAILAPTGTVDSGSTVTPRARFTNLGSSVESFKAYFIIGAGYRDSISIAGLAPQRETTGLFAGWTADTMGPMTAVCIAVTPLDSNFTNDTLRQAFIVGVTDAALDSIIAPTGTVSLGTVVTPRVRIRNLGSAPSLVPVRLTISRRTDAPAGRTADAAGARRLNPAARDRRVALSDIDIEYQDSALVFVPANSAITVTFSAWTAGPAETLIVEARTSLPGDMRPANDIKTGQVVVTTVPGDVGISSIIAPSGTVDSGSIVVPRAVLRNYSLNTQQPPVHLTIGSFYAVDTAPTIAPGRAETLSFRPWTAGETGQLDVTCYTALPGDPNALNDTATGTVTVRVPTHDVGISGIIAPTGAVDSGSIVVPRVVLRNYGTISENPPVRLTIGSLYAVDTIPTVAPGRSDTLTFPPWTAGETGPLTVTCFTALAGDANPLNDTATGLVTVRAVRRDVGISSIVAPSGTVDSGNIIVPRVVLANHGTTTERPPIHLTIGSLYTVDTTRLVSPGRSDTITFTPWIAGEAGPLTVTCYTALAGDADPSNDTATGQVTVRVPTHDVGISGIIAPTGMVDSAALVIPRVILRNHGTANEQAPIHLSIGSRYAVDTTRLIGPGRTDTLSFPPWIASEVGLLAVTCYTALAGDADPSNDTATGQVTVRPLPGIEADPAVLPKNFALGAPAPNPTAGRITVTYALPYSAQTTLAVYDATGKLVRMLIDATQPAGRANAAWDGRSQAGKLAPEGVYYVRMEASGFTATRKLIMQR